MPSTNAWKRRAFAISGLTILAASCVYLLLRNSADPGHYYEYHSTPERFVYPTHDVIVWTSVIVVELLVASGFLLVTSSLPKACMVLVLVFGVGLAAMIPFAMHAPPYFGAHTVFLIVATGWCLVAAIVTGLVGARAG